MEDNYLIEYRWRSNGPKITPEDIKGKEAHLLEKAKKWVRKNQATCIALLKALAEDALGEDDNTSSSDYFANYDLIQKSFKLREASIGVYCNPDNFLWFYNYNASDLEERLKLVDNAIRLFKED